MAEFPPTIIVVHPKERRSKCTAAPLRGKPGFLFWKYARSGPAPLENYVRLGLDGPVLSRDDAERGLLVLDGTWRWAGVMQSEYEHVPPRRLPRCRTVYPRVSKTYEDPADGLATIEAIYLAYRCLGRDVTGLLDGYHWRDEFLRENAGLVLSIDTPRRSAMSWPRDSEQR